MTVIEENHLLVNPSTNNLSCSTPPSTTTTTTTTSAWYSEEEVQLLFLSTTTTPPLSLDGSGSSTSLECGCSYCETSLSSSSNSMCLNEKHTLDGSSYNEHTPVGLNPGLGQVILTEMERRGGVPLEKELETDPWVQHLCQGHFEEVLLKISEMYPTLFVHLSHLTSFEDFTYHLSLFSSTLPSHHHFYICIACVMLYLHFNYFTFTPQGSSIITKPLPDLFFHPLALPWAKDVLARHGEHPFSHLHHPLLLVIPQRGFTHLTQTYPSARWWIQRVHRLHRDVLDLGVDLSSEWEGEVSRMQELAAWVPARWHAWMYVEHAMMRMMGGGGGGGEGGGGNLSSSSSSSVMERGLQEAGKACHFSWTFIGRLGKRTHFQTQSHAQLTVTTQRQGPVEPSSVLGAPMIPTTTVEAWPPLCLVNDETVLDQVRWDDPPTEEGSLPCKGSDALSFLEQCILLGYCRLNALTHPYDDLLAKEEQGALLQSILDPSHWHPTIRHVAVYYRSLLDLHRPRYRDRGLLQLERLTEPPFLDSPASQQGRGGAPLYFFATPMVPQWTHLLTLAHTWMRAGAYGSAVKVFERFEQWDLVIQCYLGSRLREKAEAVVHALMAQERSAQGVYWLGELKNDPKFFEEAWVLGKQKWAKPKRALGTYYFHQGNFELSLHHWKEALQLNPMHTQGWFMSGCAALRLQAWSIAAEHFSRCTSLDPEQGLAWSNLSTALLQMDQRKPAWHALHQAVKQVRNDWKVWSNLLGVSLSLKYWEDAVLAMDHIFQLAPTQLQVQDMQALVAILPTSVSSYQRDRLLWLATKLQDASSVHPSTFAWQAVLLHLYVHLNAPTSILQGCEAMVRGWQRLTHVDPSFLPDLVASCRSVWHCYKTYGPSRDEHTGLQRCSDWAYQAKLGVSGVVAKLKSDYESTPEYVQLCQLLEEIQTTLDMQPEE